MNKRVALKVLDKRLLEPVADGSFNDMLPRYATQESAGMDVRACIDEPVVIHPGHNELIPLGFAMHINDPFVFAGLVPRSGLSHKHKISTSNGLAVIDSDYLGQVYASMINNGTEPYEIQPMERIGQILFLPVIRVDYDIVAAFENPTGRGEGAFGHTGKL